MDVWDAFDGACGTDGDGTIAESAESVVASADECQD